MTESAASAESKTATAASPPAGTPAFPSALVPAPVPWIALKPPPIPAAVAGACTPIAAATSASAPPVAALSPVTMARVAASAIAASSLSLPRLIIVWSSGLPPGVEAARDALLISCRTMRGVGDLRVDRGVWGRDAASTGDWPCIELATGPTGTSGACVIAGGAIRTIDPAPSAAISGDLAPRERASIAGEEIVGS
jgi:hypothetical protein